jgi:NAD(P)-dependent dehydrogenase (short-subunit alcohol dehydrogenase family)
LPVNLRLDGQVAVITGGGRGLGAAHARGLAERGARVVVNATSPEGAGRVVSEIRAAGGLAEIDIADVSTPDGGASAIRRALDSYGRIDILVNNAGITYKAKSFLECDLESFQRMWAVHVGGTINATRAAWPAFVDQGYGRVINMGSQAGVFGQPRVPEYCAAKSAIYGLTRSLSFEGRDHGIAVNMVIPAGLSRMTDGKFAPEKLAAMRPELVSAVVIWLAHRSCEANGQSFGALAGRVGRFAIAENESFWDRQLTADDVSERLAHLRADDPILFAAGAAVAFGGTGQTYVAEILSGLPAED